MLIFENILSVECHLNYFSASLHVFVDGVAKYGYYVCKCIFSYSLDLKKYSYLLSSVYLHLPPTFSFHLQYFSISPLTSPLPAASSFSHDTSNILSLPFTLRTLVLHSLAALPRGSLSRPIKGLPHVIYFYPYFIFSFSFVASSSTNCEMIPMSRFFPLRREGDVKKLAHVGTLEEEKK